MQWIMQAVHGPDLGRSLYNKAVQKSCILRAVGACVGLVHSFIHSFLHGYTVSPAAMVAGTSLFPAHQHCTTRPFMLHRPLHTSHTRAAALARASAANEPEVVIVGAGAPNAVTNCILRI